MTLTKGRVSVEPMVVRGIGRGGLDEVFASLTITSRVDTASLARP